MQVPQPARLATREPDWSASARKYLNIFRASLVERMAYRGDFLLGTMLRFLPVLTTILLWEAIFAGSGSDELAGFTKRQMIAYLLLIHISRMFSSMPGLAAGVTRDIRDGSLKKYLVQPLDMIGYLLAYRAAHKTAYITTSAIPYGLLFLACSYYFDGLPDALTFAGYLVSLLLGFLVGFFFEACLGMVGFWLLEVTSLLWIVGTLNYFVSGQMLPLDLLPGFWADLLKSMPFQYMAYFPAVVFLGKVSGWELVRGLAWQFGWVVFFAFLTRWLFRRGLRRYSAFGG
jgi:ABC-2 type transport system permease protein